MSKTRFHTKDLLKLTIDDFKLLKKLKSTRIESGYIESISIWEDYCSHQEEDVADFLQFFAMHVIFTDKFIQKHNVEKYHINLIRALYFKTGDDWISLDCKRPYGNSFILGDVFDEYIKICDKPYVIDEIDEIEGDFYADDYDEDDEYIQSEEGHKFLLDIHIRTLDIFDLALAELELNSFEWISDVNNWTYGRQQFYPTEKGLYEYRATLREDKLKRVLCI